MWEVSVELGATVWCSVSSVEECVSVKEMHVSVYRLSMVTSIIYGVSSLSLSPPWRINNQSLSPTYLTRSRVSALQLTVTGMDPIMTEARRNAALWVGGGQEIERIQRVSETRRHRDEVQDFRVRETRRYGDTEIE